MIIVRGDEWIFFLLTQITPHDQLSSNEHDLRLAGEKICPFLAHGQT